MLPLTDSGRDGLHEVFSAAMLKDQSRQISAWAERQTPYIIPDSFSPIPDARGPRIKCLLLASEQLRRLLAPFELTVEAASTYLVLFIWIDEHLVRKHSTATSNSRSAASHIGYPTSQSCHLVSNHVTPHVVIL